VVTTTNGCDFCTESCWNTSTSSKRVVVVVAAAVVVATVDVVERVVVVVVIVVVAVLVVVVVVVVAVVGLFVCLAMNAAIISSAVFIEGLSALSDGKVVVLAAVVVVTGKGSIVFNPLYVTENILSGKKCTS